MGIELIPDNEGLGFTLVNKIEDFEKVNPINQYKNLEIETTKHILLSRYLMEKPKFSIELLNDIAIKNANESWDKRYNEIINTKYSENLNQLLLTNKKKEQIRLLKNLSISHKELTSFIFNSFLNYGYLYSFYTVEHLQNGLEKSEMPKLLNIEGNKIKISGNTKLSDGQLKQAINHRKVIISKFIENGDKWHCFFYTFNSLKGAENWKEGKPHLHYISYTFGLTRKEVLTELKSKDYKLNNLPHIELRT